MGFVYKWVHTPTLKWYVGSHTGKKASNDDGYICSSKTVKPLILANPVVWQRTIIAEGNDAEMRELEAEILQTLNAAQDPRSFNLNNAEMKAAAWNSGMYGEKHHRYGKKLDYKKPFTVTEKFLSQQREQNKKRNAIQAECPHCKKTGQMVAMKRWHFDNCSSL